MHNQEVYVQHCRIELCESIAFLLISFQFLFNYCRTKVLSLSTVGSLVDHSANKPYTLVGGPV